MGFEIINKLKKEQGLTNAQISAMAGITLSTLDKITSGANTNPKLDTLQAICRVLGCTLNDFADLPAKKSASPGLPEDALKIARDYKDLDHHGKTAVKVIVDVEKKRVEAEKARQREKNLREDVDGEFGGSSTGRVIPLYFTPAAAGYISPAFGEDFDYIEVGGEVPVQADFAVNIEGDSMEPYIMDGATVYVNRDPIAEGDVGIFFLDGDMLCKQYHRDEEGNVYLLSLNREREDADRFIPVDSGMSLTCFGRVMMQRG